MNGEGFTDCSPIFVVGSGRSGTTLLQMMLNAHPDITVAGELHFFDQILELRKLIPDLETKGRVDQLFRSLPSVAGFQYLIDVEPVLAEARHRLLAADRPGYGLLYRFLLEGFCRQGGARRFGEKTTANLRYLDDLVQLFPDCRIIHIVRDPRAAVASRLNVPWASDDIVTNALKWKLEVSCGRSFAAQHECARSPNFLEIRYEDVVADPAQILRRVCNFIGERYDGRMLDYHDSSAILVEKEPWKSGTTKPVYGSSLDAWRSRLSERQVFLIELITGAEMDHYGYARSEFSHGAALLSPWQATLEIARWLKYKWAEQRVRRGKAISVYGEQRRLLKIMWRRLVR
jgi:hypothetical protein